MNDEEVEVVNAPVCELLLGDWLDALLVVEGVPAGEILVSLEFTRPNSCFNSQLRDDEQLLTLDEAILDRSCYTFTSLLLVAIIAGTVEKAVPSLDGVVDLIGAGIVVHLPKAEAHKRHLFYVSGDSPLCVCLVFTFLPLFSAIVGALMLA